MIRITHLGKYYPPAPGGIETHLQTLARTEAELGADVRVLCVNHADHAGNDVTFERFRTTPTREEDDGPVRITRIGRVASLARLDLCPKLLGHLREAQRETDVLHLHTPNPTMLLALSAVGMRVPQVVTHHSDVVRQRILRHALAPFERAVYRRAAAIIATSADYAAGSRALVQFRDKVSIVPLGINLEPYLRPSAESLAHARRLREEFGQPLWLMVGRLIYYKGVHVALRALTDVPGKLLVIGTGPLAAELCENAKAHGVEDRVICGGYAPPHEVVGAYHAATALWFPSTARSEAFGLSQVEAMASGCPVINTAIRDSGAPWVCPHEEAGLTIPVNDPDALAAAARRILTEPGLRVKLAAGGLARAVAEFDRRRMGERCLEICRIAVSESARLTASPS